MDTFYLIFAITFFTTVWNIASSLTVSLYGASYINVPLEDASSETDVRLQFRTTRPDGLLLLAAGETDFCVLELQGGMVRARIDLGSGEATVSSPTGLVFNDLRLHKVRLFRQNARVELHIDDIYTTTVTTPGRFYELNVAHGIYLGTLRSTDDVFFGHFGPYRGCLQDVFFNTVDVLFQARTVYNAEPLHTSGVTWECSPEFAATADQPLSFLTNTSFVAFPGITERMEVLRLTFDVRTRTQHGLLLYHSGKLHNSDFVVLEIVNGDLILRINKGSGALEFLSRDFISDGVWHQIEVIVDPFNVRLAVNGNRQERRTNFGNNNFLDLDGYLYVGGVDIPTRAKAVQFQLPSMAGPNAAAGSVIGCVQNFKVNGVAFGFREAEVTNALDPGCMWTFPCAADPCVEDGVCIEEGYYHYRCVCEEANCFKNDQTSSEVSMPVSSMLHIQDIVVREGENVLITASNIEPLADYQGHGIPGSSVLYRVVAPPEHGNILFREGYNAPSSAERGDLSFTQEDVLNNRVTYAHDDTESTSDSIALELEFLGNKRNLPLKFHQTYPFSLMINVAPWNDRPQLRLPPANKLVIVQNTFLIMTPELLLAEDRDDQPGSLEYSVQYQQGYDLGYFEIADTLGVRARIYAFTQQDVNDGKIKYVHRGTATQHFRVQVSDGKEMSEPQVLRVEAVPLKLSKQSNTGLNVFAGTITVISDANLMYATNAPNQHIDIRYDVTDPPYYGLLERQQLSTGVWLPSTVFTQEDISERRVRYSHNSSSGRPENDYFRYRVHSMDVTTQEYEFFIHITPIRTDLVNNAPLMLEGTKEGTMNSSLLRAVSSVQSHNTRDIVFQIVAVPLHGDVAITDGFDKIKLSVGMNFTQRDIDMNRLMYRLRRSPNEALLDSFEFRLIIPGYTSETFSFTVNYEPGAVTQVQRINNQLEGVMEGGYALISKNDLYIETPPSREYRYTVLNYPKHGVLQIRDPLTGEIIADNVTVYTNRDIREKKLHYHHDDTETTEDTFEFQAEPSNGPVTDENTFHDTFEIQIDLENDNPPVRVVHKVINVVRNRGKLLTTEDIAYLDPDVDFNSDNLIYTKHEMENGNLVLSSNHNVSVYNFTQAELASGLVFFMHAGPRYGRSVLRVTDGTFTTNGSLEVRASEPYLRINASGLVVEKGLSVSLTSMNLSLDSNVNVEDEEVSFLILTAPAHGAIIQAGNNQPKTQFSLHDIKRNRILYQHDGSNNVHDSFHFVARIAETEVETEVAIRVLMETHSPQPLIIEENNPLVLDEGTQAAISKQLLRVSHESTLENDIVYMITRYPTHGSLVFSGNQNREISYFTQAHVNRRKLRYVHMEIGPNTDSFTFNVTNGALTLENIVFNIRIVPYMIPLVAHNFTVREGESQALDTTILEVTDPHFRQQALVYVVVRAPSSGYLVDAENPRLALIQFSQSQLMNEQIYYKHDGNDTLHDSFTLMAKAPIEGAAGAAGATKQSYPATVHVWITPENDQAPRVLVNSRLEVWTGSRATLTRHYLRAVDQDSPASEILYEVSKPTNGELKLVDYMDSSVTNFTQQQIDDEKVIFVHTGGMAGEFHFKVSDGRNSDRRRTFVITASPLRLTLSNEQVLEVFPGVLQPIRREHLFTKTNDANYSSDIIYMLESIPSYGRLFSNKAGSIFEVSSFTQEEIDSGTIAYRHFSHMDDFEQYDSFIFEVSAPFADNIKYEQFEITTSFEYINLDNLDQLVTMVPVSVEEGGQLSITRNNLDPEKLLRHLYESGVADHFLVSFIIVRLPEHGSLILRGNNITNGTTFTQGDIDGGDLIYFHDHSESLRDSFLFKIQIQYNDDNGRIIKRAAKLVIPFNVSVLPINDQAFKLITHHPAMTLVQGFVGQITSDRLLTIDPDTRPKELLYRIKDGPSGGYLAYEEDLDEPITTFTQADINAGRVFFVQDGRVYHGGFYFSVDDGHFTPVFASFNVRIQRLELNLNRLNDLELVQGQVAAVLKPELFGIETNGEIEHVMFNVTKEPIYGYLFHNNKPALQFSFSDIRNGLVNYVQTDMNRSTDTIELKIYDSYNAIYNKQMNIKITPLVKSTARMPFTVKPGEAAFITLEYLDASELMQMTGSMPLYIIETVPRHGKLVKLVHYRTRRDTGNTKMSADGSIMVEVPVDSFTHQDVAEGIIQYKAAAKTTYREMRDSFSYSLRASHVQPAPGVFSMTLPATDETTVAPLTPPKSTAPTSQNDDKEAAVAEAGAGSIVRKDTLMIVIIITVVTVAILLIFIICKCCKRRRNAKRKQREWQAEEEEMKALKGHDSRLPIAPHNVYTDPYRDEPEGHASHSPDRYDHQHAVPVAVDYTDHHSHHCSKTPSIGSLSYDAQTKVLPCRMSSPHHQPLMQQQQQPSLDRSDYGTGSAHHSPDLELMLETRAVDSSPMPDHGVPECKVIRISDRPGSVEGLDSSCSEARPCVTGVENGTPPRLLNGPRTGVRSTQQSPRINWQNMDPELLQHYRKTNPVLHTTKHWV